MAELFVFFCKILDKILIPCYIILVNANIGVKMESCSTEKHNRIREKLLNSNEYQNEVNSVSTMFSLLGDASRMKIVLALSEGELCVYHLCEITGGKQSAISQHLRKLKDNHIVKSRKDANQVLYSLADEHIASIVKMALEHQHCL